MQQLAEWQYGLAGLDAAADLRGDLTDFAPGSRNLIPDGAKQSRPFRGLDILGTGGRKMVQIRDSWGCLDDDGLTKGRGSFFSSIAEMLVYVGAGQLRLETEIIPGAIASAILKFLLKWNGSYTDPNSGPYPAGLPEPGKPVIGIISGDIYGAPNLTGTVSIKQARYRKTTGGRSRASATSDVITIAANEHKSIYVVCEPIVTGQTNHIFFGTDTKFGGIGLHYRIARANPFTNSEYREEDVERRVTITQVTGANDILNGAAGTFSAGDIGKLVENVSGGVVTVPAGTTVTEIISTSQVKISNAVTAGPAGTVTLVSYAGNVRRGVVLNWTPSDLTEETEWIYDFPPPSASHAMQIENRMWVCAYADASAKAQETATAPDDSASASSPGTALVPSIPNQFESYDPRYPLYLPERVIDILSDGMDGYKFIGGLNGIYALQHLNVERATPGTLTVLLRGEGIATSENWCARERAIYLYTGNGPVRITEGGVVDKQFAAKVRHQMQGIDQADMVVQGHPRGQGVMYAAGTRCWIFDETTGRWSTEIRLDDTYAGSIVSAVATQSRLIITKEDQGIRTAYRFDEGNSSEYVVGTGHYQDDPAPEAMKMIQRLRGAFVADKLEPHYVGLHVDTLPTYCDDGAIEEGTNLLSSGTAAFNTESIGSYVLIRKAGAGGTWLFARIIGIVVPGKCLIGTPVPNLADSVALNASKTVSGAYVLAAFRIYPVMPRRTGTVEFDSQEICLPGHTSYCVSIMQPTDASHAQPLKAFLDGTLQREEGWNRSSSLFG
jgi:hypothetical protein